MIQAPCAAYNPYAQQPMTYGAPAPQQPSYNAVKIDIHNPSVTPQAQQPTVPMYNYPQQQVYNYPQAQAPVYYPPMTTPCCQFPPAGTVPMQPQPEVVAPAAQPLPPVVTPAPEQPVQVQQQNINYPVQPAQIPAPVITEQPQVQQPQAQQPVETTAPAQAPEVVAGQDVTPQVDLNTFIAKLSNPSFEAQNECMTEIAKLVKENPEQATELVDTKVFDALSNIINFDSSKLEEANAEQTALREKLNKGEQLSEQDMAKATQLSPKEAAETNKCLALYTSAIMQKLYVDEVAKLSNSTVPLTDLPGATTMVDNLKDNPNPMVRACAIESLSYLQRPEYKKDLTTVFTVAKNDSDPEVSKAAASALEKLEAVA